jgi:phosphatidylserine decarboxylase precursor
MKSKSVQKLKKILDGNKSLKSLVEKSIAKAKEINPDKATNPAQTLDEYYDFLDSSLTRMPWKILDEDYYHFHKDPDLAFRTDQCILYPYWILDIPLEELKNNNKFYNSVEYLDEISEWLTDYCNEWKEFLDSPKSWNEEIHQIFKNEKSFQLDKGWFEDCSNWKSFNQFFSRKLKGNSRPIESIEDDSIIISPADSLPQGVWDINKNGQFHAEGITDDHGVILKSTTFIDIEQLLGEKCKKYGKNFYGGKLTHTYLHYNDYHRYHFPISGTVLEAEIITPSPLVGGIVYWDTKKNSYVLKSNSLSWQAFEERGVVILETLAGLVALLPIGMGQVSSVNFESNVKKGLKVRKGDPLGYFLFGGSDFVMIFEEKANFQITVEKGGEVKGYSNGYHHVKMGEKYGMVKKIN